jgi:hypothetical protein
MLCMLLALLQGCDLLLYQALSSAGLSPKLVPLLRTGQGWDENDMSEGDDSEEQQEEEDEDEEDEDEEGEEREEPGRRGQLLLGTAFGGPQRLGEPQQGSDEDSIDYKIRRHEYREEGTFWYMDDGGPREERKLLRCRHGAARLAADFVWAKPPNKQHWMYKDRVSAWGNESYDAVWYVAAVLVVAVPACGMGCRA